MDQTPLPFVLDDGTTYEHHGSKDVCCKTGASGLEKRQATAQITIFADGVPRVKPLIIFKGKGLRISTNEKKAWDSRVTVFFQANAWCDEEIMVKWINSEWNNFFLNPSTPVSDGKILVADIHRAQQTENVKRLLARCKTKLVNIPGGCTSLLQPVDVSFNGPFKAHVRAMSEKHLNENLDKYTDGKISASERRILMTKWVGEAWANTNQDMVQRSFKKCGISLALDGSENHLLNIEKLPEYAMPEEVAEMQEYELLSDDEDEGEGNENDEFDIMEEYELLSDDEDEGEGNENDEFDIMEELQ